MKTKKENNEKEQNWIKGYKVFKSDWTCDPTGDNPKQYSCPGKFEEEGGIKVGYHGMHFYKYIFDCFNNYDFDSNNRVAEVVAYGEVRTIGDESCTNKLEIVREIPWTELLKIVNIGKECTGYCNTGDCNAGGHNTGHYNIGNWNSGHLNTGCNNTGNMNTGDENAGDCNTGNKNTGDKNAGNNNAGSCNTGDNNAGNFNTGDGNAGNCNAGNGNTGYNNKGDRNTGDSNIGDRNTGDWNKSSFNTGCFNTREQKIRLFDKPSNMTYYEWTKSDARRILGKIQKDVVEWINEEDMTDEEKTEYPTYKTTGGYLKVLDEFECAQLWWDSLSERDKNIIKAIPNFDADIFEECTGIKVDKIEIGS